jgi:predicted phage tail component-like protein
MPFEVDENGILRPLGVTVLRDSRFELLPGTRDYFEEVPGRHGEIDFGSELEARAIELHCYIEVTPADWPAKRRELAAYLNPLAGPQTLTFADEPGKVYRVRYSGKIDLTRYPHAREFTIPFRMCDPFIVGAVQNELVGSGVANNNGTVETPFILIIQGAVTNPSVTVGGYTLTYTGTIEAGSALVIDTEKLTAVLDDANALPNVSGLSGGLRLQPGSNNVVAASAGTTTIRWYDRYL